MEMRLNITAVLRGTENSLEMIKARFAALSTFEEVRSLHFKEVDIVAEEKRKTPEQLKKYKTEYYKQHKDRYIQLVAEWRKANPIQSKAIADRWLAKHPHYQRDYQRKRKAATEPLIFEFLDNGFGSDIDGYTTYLRTRGVPEKHVKWFLKDVQKYLKDI